jgi:hypothetical protein
MNVYELEEKTRALEARVQVQEAKIKCQEEIIKNIVNTMGIQQILSNNDHHEIKPEQLNTVDLNEKAHYDNIEEYDKISRLQDTVHKLVGKIIFDMGHTILNESDPPIAILMFRRIHHDLMMFYINGYKSQTNRAYIISLQEIVYWLIKTTLNEDGESDKSRKEIDYMFNGPDTEEKYNEYCPTISKQIEWLQDTLYVLILRMFCRISEARIIHRLINYMYHGVFYEDGWYITKEELDRYEEQDNKELDGNEFDL